MGQLEERVLHHFEARMVPSISRWQGESKDLHEQLNVNITPSIKPVSSLDEVVQELLDCCSKLHVYDVSLFHYILSL